jgi:hypothetical protein
VKPPGKKEVMSFSLGSVAHAFVLGAEKLKSALITAENLIKKDAPQIAEAETLANAVVSQIYPGAAPVTAAIEAGMAKIFDAVDAAGDAAVANGLSVSLDTATVAAIKAALPMVKAQAATVPGS